MGRIRARRHGYTGGSPLNATDPSGRFCIVHNDSGGCKGAGVLEAAQKPIAVVGLVSPGISVVAADVALVCTVTAHVPCVVVAKIAGATAGLINTAASTEQALYACATKGASTDACKTAMAGFQLSLANTTASFFGDPITQAVLAHINFAATLGGYTDEYPLADGPCDESRPGEIA